MFYLIFVIVSALLIILYNAMSVGFSLGSLLDATISVAIGAAAIFIVDAILALAIRRLTPQCLYKPECILFRVSKREKKLYTKLKIKKWKDVVPELGVFTGFSKSEIKSTNDPKYLHRFLIESNYGVVIHLANAIFGFVILFIPLCSRPSIWVPIFIVNFILSMLPVFILRHTTHTLFRLYKKSQRKK